MIINLNFQFYLKNKKSSLKSINKKVKLFQCNISLNGVTGSGKTRVYMNIVKEKLKKNFNV